MAVKLPTADYNFKVPQSQLARFAANVYAQMNSAAGIILFPTPEIALTALLTAINAYTTALAAAHKGSKASTTTKNNARAALEAILRANAEYVTQVAQGVTGPANTTTIAAMRETILASGYKLSKLSGPIANSTGIKVPKVLHMISNATGTIHVLLRQYTRFKKAVKSWQVQYRVPASGSTPAGPWQNAILTSGNGNITGVPSGPTEVRIAAIGGHRTNTNSRNPIIYTTPRTIIVT